ncbi:hypothetical protein HGRIS_002677 [Hohenbuehelia grisea]|uniref:RING-type domain-containing protein n=1 Tax=Hohenbuehelia grisea TaxID=104357 RepID=A0ABR3JLC6_9AGAR
MAAPHTLACGHVYCTPCIQNFLTSAFDSDPFAIRCVGNENQCLASLPIPTLQRFLSDERFNRLLEIAFHFHVRTHAAEFVNCKTPDCIHIFRRSLPPSPTTTLQCPSCFSTVCSSCAEDAHDGITCETYRINRDPAEQERLNEEWMRASRGRVKRCPSCNVLIEKLEGCNHMECRCGKHLCWSCMRVFDTGRETYDHMNATHGGFYAGEHNPLGAADNVDVLQQQELLREVGVRREQEQGYHHLFAQQAVDRRLREVQLQREAAQVQADHERQRRQAEAHWHQQRLNARAEAQREERRRLELEREQQQQQGGWSCLIM